MAQQEKTGQKIILGKVDYNDNQYVEISENDFLPPEDRRRYNSGMRDVCRDNNFDTFLEEFYEAYEADLYDDIV